MKVPIAFSVPSLRRTTSSLGIVVLTLSLAACNSTPTPQGATTESAPADFVYDGTDTSWSDDGAGTSGVVMPLSLTDGDNLLSFEKWTSASSGYGPIEVNKSNGGKNANDGRTLSLGGKTYASGFGVHANSQMTFALNGRCATFMADVGVDDEVGDRGSVVFQVFADGQKVYDSGVVRGTDAAKTLKVSVAGKDELKLVVTNGGDDNTYDHADWANASLTCGGAGSGDPGPVKYSGPLVITKGGTYSGNWESLDPTVPAVTVKTGEPVVIENSNIRSRGNIISGFYNRLTVRNTRGYALNPNVAGRVTGRAVNAEENYSLRVENSYFEGTSGIYVRQYRGDPAKGETVKLLRNKFRNVNGRISDGNGGFTDQTKIVQTILFNHVQHIPGVEIAWNEIVNEPNKSRTEENINFYLSSGTAGSPMRIHDNYIQGAYPVNPATNPSYPGGGILLGDGKVTNPEDNGHSRVYNNQIVGTTNHGLGISGGVDNQMYNNRVISSGRLPDGTRIPSANVGLYVWDPKDAGELTPPTFANNVMRDNTVGWTKVSSSGQTSNNPVWTPDCGLNGTICSNNQNIGTVTLDMEHQEYQHWQDKLASAHVKVGP